MLEVANRSLCFLLITLCLSVSVATYASLSTISSERSSPPADLKEKVDGWVSANQRAIVTELVELLAIPNVAADRDNIRKNAARLREMLVRRGFTTEILETAGNPLVWGELKAPGATRTLLLYAHYDGQPVNAKDGPCQRF